MIEPMSVEEIKRVMEFSIWNGELFWPARLVLAWAHERARAQMFYSQVSSVDFNACLNEVLDEIGWPKESR